MQVRRTHARVGRPRAQEQLPPTIHSNNPCEPLRRGRSMDYAKGQAYFFKYRTAPTSNSLSDITPHEVVIPALSRLDADVKLSQMVRKQKRYLHAVIAVERIR